MNSKKWKEVKLGDICTLNYGKALTAKNRIDGNIPVYSSAGITGRHNAPLVESEGVIIGRKGSVGTVYYSSSPFFCIDTAYYILPSKEYSLRYLFYRLKSLGLEALNEDSAVPGLNRETAYSQLFLLPPYDEQLEIESILSSLDDKIEQNKRINDKLEQQIQAIYNSIWTLTSGEFVTMSSLIEVRDGTHDSPKAQKSGKSLVTSKHLLPYGVDLISTNLISESDFDKINDRSKVESLDILISMIGTVGLISLVIENNIEFAIKNVGLFKTSQRKELVYYIHSYLKSSAAEQNIYKCLAGSTQKYISLGELRKMLIIQPTKEKLLEFNNIVAPMYDLIINNTNECLNLVALRDALIPILMSGEIDKSGVNL